MQNTSQISQVSSQSEDTSNASLMESNYADFETTLFSTDNLSKEDIELIKKELERKIEELKEDLENSKNTRGWLTSAANSVASWFGFGDKKAENEIAQYEALLLSLDENVANIDEAYKTITGVDLDINSFSALQNSQIVSNSIDREAQEAIIVELESQLLALEESFETAQNSNGWISGTWNSFKNWTGLGASSNKTSAEIADLKEQIELLKNGEANLASVYKNITGDDLNYDNLSLLLSNEEGTGLDSISMAGQSVNNYSEGQKMSVDVFADILSGIASVGVVAFGGAAGICAAPFTAGASLGMVAAGFGLAAGAGALVKSAIKSSDCIGNEKEYSLKDLGYDVITGSLNGAAAPLTNALGGAAGTTIMKACGQEALETTIKSSALATAKGIAREVVEESVEQTGKKAISTTLAKGASFLANSMVDGGLSGFVDGSSRALAEGRAEDILSDGTEGLIGGLIASPVIGAGFNLAGKVGTVVAGTKAGKAIENVISFTKKKWSLQQIRFCQTVLNAL